METGHLLPVIMRRFHLAKLLMHNDWDAIKTDLKRYKLGWGLDEHLDFNDQNNLLAALEKVGVYSDKVIMWGDGSVYREMMCSDDLADACIYLMNNKDYDEIGEFVNITKGDDIQLKNLFELTKRITNYQGKIEYDTSKPNGTPRKMMDATRIKALGWEPKISLEEGIKSFYSWYQSL